MSDQKDFMELLSEKIDLQLNNSSREDKKILQDAKDVIDNATPEQIMEAQEMREGLKDLKDSYFALVSKALRSFIERMHVKSDLEINDRTIKRDMLLRLLPKHQTCHTQEFYNIAAGKKSTLYITVDICGENYSFEREMDKITKTKSFPDDRAESVKEKQKNGRFALNAICSRMISSVNIFWKEFYLTHKTIIDKITGEESQKLIYDPANVTFALDDKTKIGLHFLIE